jgi:hypothetical protein
MVNLPLGNVEVNSDEKSGFMKLILSLSWGTYKIVLFALKRSLGSVSSSVRCPLPTIIILRLACLLLGFTSLSFALYF